MSDVGTPENEAQPLTGEELDELSIEVARISQLINKLFLAGRDDESTPTPEIQDIYERLGGLIEAISASPEQGVRVQGGPILLTRKPDGVAVFLQVGLLRGIKFFADTNCVVCGMTKPLHTATCTAV